MVNPMSDYILVRPWPLNDGRESQKNALFKGRMIENVNTAGVHLWSTSEAEFTQNWSICQCAQDSDDAKSVLCGVMELDSREPIAAAADVLSSVLWLFMLSLLFHGRFIHPVNGGQHHDFCSQSVQRTALWLTLSPVFSLGLLC